MALSNALSAGSDAESEARGVPGSVKANWFQAHGDATQSGTASTDPLTITQTGARWVNVGPGCNQLHLRLGVPDGDATTTPPTVDVWGLDTAVEPGSTAAPTGKPRQIADGIALSGTKEAGDGTTDWRVADESITDLKGCRAILVHIVNTPSLATSGTIEGCFLN